MASASKIAHVVEDSTELLRASRIERTAELLRASGTLTRDDPIWWDVARSTIEHFTRVRDAVFGEEHGIPDNQRKCT